MKITSQASAHVQAPTAAAVSEGTEKSQVPAAGGGSEEKLQSAVLQPAQATMDALPDIDMHRVAELREALAGGKLPFDAGKLAGLIDRYHGGRS